MTEVNKDNVQAAFRNWIYSRYGFYCNDNFTIEISLPRIVFTFSSGAKINWHEVKVTKDKVTGENILTFMPDMK